MKNTQLVIGLLFYFTLRCTHLCCITLAMVPLQVNFSYTEAGESKQALVKLVACKRLVVLLHLLCIGCFREIMLWPWLPVVNK